MCREIQYVDWHVEVELPKQPIVGRAVVLIEDLASSGHTISHALPRLKAAGAASVAVVLCRTGRFESVYPLSP